MDRLEVKNITKTFGKKTAVDNLSFICKEGETTVILGPTGAGKTTTLKLIAGLEELNSGEVYIDGVNVNNLYAYKRNCAMTFEDYALYPHMTVYENIAFPLKAPARKDKFSGKDIKNRVEEIAKLLQIDELLNRKPLELSGGQRQRVALGRTLVRKPKIFLLDEPIAHLDAVLRHRMRGEMKRIFKELKVTVLYATHDFTEALAIGDKIIIINNGKLVQLGTSNEIYNRSRNIFVAKLVGDPPINFIEGTLLIKGDKFVVKFKIGKINFISKEESLKQWIGENITVGVRPYDIKLLKNEEENSLKGNVLSIEPISSKYIITSKLATGEIFKIKSKERYKTFEDNEVWLKIDINNIHLFDSQSGMSIYHGRGL